MKTQKTQYTAKDNMHKFSTSRNNLLDDLFISIQNKAINLIGFQYRFKVFSVWEKLDTIRLPLGLNIGQKLYGVIEIHEK